MCPSWYTTHHKRSIYDLKKRKLSNRSKPPHIKMPDKILIVVSRSKLRRKFEQRPMLWGHMTLNEFIAICTEGFREIPCNWPSAFTLISRKASDVEEEKVCLTLWARILGKTRWNHTTCTYHVFLLLLT